MLTVDVIGAAYSDWGGGQESPLEYMLLEVGSLILVTGRAGKEGQSRSTDVIVPEAAALLAAPAFFLQGSRGSASGPTCQAWTSNCSPEHHPYISLHSSLNLHPSSFNLPPYALRCVHLLADQSLPPSQVSPTALAQRCPILPSFLKNDSFRAWQSG